MKRKPWSGTHAQENLALVPANLTDPPTKKELLDFRCGVCGKPGLYGAGVCLRKGEVGRWYCGPHWHASADGAQHAMERAHLAMETDDE